MTGSFPPLTGDEVAAKTEPLRAKDRRAIKTKCLRILSNVDIFLPRHDENTVGIPNHFPKHSPRPLQPILSIWISSSFNEYSYFLRLSVSIIPIIHLIDQHHRSPLLFLKVI